MLLKITRLTYKHKGKWKQNVITNLWKPRDRLSNEHPKTLDSFIVDFVLTFTENTQEFDFL